MALTTPGQSLTLTEAIALVRQLAFDLDANNYALTDPQWTAEINQAFQVWYEANNRRPTRLAGTAAWGTIATQSTPGVTATSADLTVLEWTRLFYDGATTPVTAGSYAVGPELELMSVSDALAAQLALGQGIPAYAAVEKQAFVGNAFNDIGKWVLYLAPMPTGSIYVSADARRSPGLYGTTGTDYIDCSEAESRIMVTVAAARVCGRLGKPAELVSELWRMVPQDMQAILRVKNDVEPSPKVRAA